MAIFSKELSAKLLGRDWSFGYNCYEVGHTWTPHCTAAALEVSLASTVKIIPLYAMLYSFSQLAISRRYDIDSSVDTLCSVIRSSCFIFFATYNGSLMGCGLRHAFGRFYYRVLVCAPALISSYISLVIEKPHRRQALAFYVLNMASEIVYRMAVQKGYFQPVYQGETLLFAMSLAAWYHLIKTHGFGHDPVSGVVKVLIGRSEAKSRGKLIQEPLAPVSTDGTISSSLNQLGDTDTRYPSKKDHLLCYDRKIQVKQNVMQNKILGQFEKLFGTQRALEVKELLLHKHSCCPHQEPSCAKYVFGPVASRFAIGYAVQFGLHLTKNPIETLLRPGPVVWSALTSVSSIRSGMFVCSLVTVGRLTSCALRNYSGNNTTAWHAPMSGFLAGLSMLWAPRSSLSMYVMWKAVEQYYLLAHRQGKVKHFQFTIMSIYACSAALILYTFALEPRFVRPSYMKFIDNMSDHRLHQMNRMVLDVFGTGSSMGYEDFFPDLDPKYMSNQFKELVFNWMIQPYE